MKDHPLDNLTSSTWLRRAIIGVLLAGLVLLGFAVLQPFLISFVWAGILCFVSNRLLVPRQ